MTDQSLASFLCGEELVDAVFYAVVLPCPQRGQMINICPTT